MLRPLKNEVLIIYTKESPAPYPKGKANRAASRAALFAGHSDRDPWPDDAMPTEIDSIEFRPPIRIIHARSARSPLSALGGARGRFSGWAEDRRIAEWPIVPSPTLLHCSFASCGPKVLAFAPRLFLSFHCGAHPASDASSPDQFAFEPFLCTATHRPLFFLVASFLSFFFSSLSLSPGAFSVNTRPSSSVSPHQWVIADNRVRSSQLTFAFSLFMRDSAKKQPSSRTPSPILFLFHGVCERACTFLLAFLASRTDAVPTFQLYSPKTSRCFFVLFFAF